MEESSINYPASTIEYWLFGLLVRTRYRGAGIGEGLVRTALQRAASEGAAKINLMVWEQNRAAINLYRKIGFRQISGRRVRGEEQERILGRRVRGLDRQLNQDVREAKHQRVIMSLNLSIQALKKLDQRGVGDFPHEK